MNFSNRWVQLTAGIVGMISVANFQYSWTLFVEPLREAHGWERGDIQRAFFFFFVPAQTWLVPLEGYLAERFGPRKLLVGAGGLAGLGWILSAYAESLGVLYFRPALDGLGWTLGPNAAPLGLLYAGQAFSGCGSGIVYGISVGSALKWFPDRRGLAAGLTAAAFGAGAAGTVRPIRWTIDQFGYQDAFLWFGTGQALIIILAALIMRFPRAGEVPAPAHSPVLQSGRDFTPLQTLRSGGFWLLYVMITLGAIPGVLMLGYIAPLAHDFGVASVDVYFLGITSAALPLALELDRVMGGLTRPAFGWISDRIGREIAIFLAFSLEGIALFFLIRHADEPIWFVLMSGLAFFGYGAIFSLFPALIGDMFGRAFATTNYGLLYTAKGTAALAVDVLVRTESGNWPAIFAVMIAADAIAALLALLVLRPLRARSQESGTRSQGSGDKAERPGAELPGEKY